MHIEARKGNQKQAIDYCMKDGDYYIFGEKKHQGTRSDLEDVNLLINEGGKVSDIITRCGIQYIKYHKGIEEAINNRSILDYACKVTLTPDRIFSPHALHVYCEDDFKKYQDDESDHNF